MLTYADVCRCFRGRWNEAAAAAYQWLDLSISLAPIAKWHTYLSLSDSYSDYLLHAQPLGMSVTPPIAPPPLSPSHPSLQPMPASVYYSVYLLY